MTDNLNHPSFGSPEEVAAEIEEREQDQIARIREFMRESYHPITDEKYREAIGSITFLLGIIDESRR